MKICECKVENEATLFMDWHLVEIGYNDADHKNKCWFLFWCDACEGYRMLRTWGFMAPKTVNAVLYAVATEGMPADRPTMNEKELTRE